MISMFCFKWMPNNWFNSFKHQNNCKHGITFEENVLLTIVCTGLHLHIPFDFTVFLEIFMKRREVWSIRCNGVTIMWQNSSYVSKMICFDILLFVYRKIQIFCIFRGVKYFCSRHFWIYFDYDFTCLSFIECN